MKTSTFSVIAAAALSSVVSAVHVGFSVGSNNPDGTLRNQTQWEEEFQLIKKWGGNSARLFGTSGGVLAAAAPAAKAANITLIAGLWALPPDHFQDEKAALLQSIQDNGHEMLVGISVGSEDLYRGDVPVDTLIEYVNEVRAEVRALGADTWVGVTDTWTSWVDANNYGLIDACDMIITDAYPFWQGVDIDAGKDTLYAAFNATKAASKAATNGPIPRYVWIGETGWPTSGPSNRSAVPSVENAQKYYQDTWCSLIKDNVDFYWYTTNDSPYLTGVEAAFGIADSASNLKYNITCPK